MLERSAETEARHTDIEDACSHFLEQAKVALPVGGLTIITLEPHNGMGRVAFRWEGAPDVALGPDSAEVSAGPGGPDSLPVLSIPLYGGDGPVGGLLLSCSRPGGFSPLECRLARDISGLLAVRLDNAQLRQRLRAAGDALGLAREAVGIAAESPTMDCLFARLVAILGASLEFDWARLSWIAPDQHRIHSLGSQTGTPGLQWPRLSAPIIWAGRIIASLELSRAGASFSRAERESVTLLGQQIAPAVQGARSQPSSAGGDRGRPPAQESKGPGDLAHALYSPLTSIKGYTSALLEPGAQWPPEVVRQFLHTIDQSADRLNQAIRDLLQPPFAGTGAPALSLSPLRLEDLMDRLAAGPSVNPSGAVRFHRRLGLPEVAVDPGLIRRVVRYLADCCLYYLGPGATLLVEAGPGSRGPVISIGPGPQSRHQPGPVNSSNPEWDHDLRVVVCRNILESHGVDLTVEVTDQGVPHFRFPLPVAR